MTAKSSYELVGFRVRLYKKGAYLHQEEIDRDGWYFPLEDPPTYSTDVKFLVDIADVSLDAVKRIRWGSYDRVLTAKEDLVKLSVDFMGNSYGGWLTGGIEYEVDNSGEAEVFSEHMPTICGWIKQLAERIKFDEQGEKRFSLVSLWEYDSNCAQSSFSDDDDCWPAWTPIGLITNRHLFSFSEILEAEKGKI